MTDEPLTESTADPERRPLPPRAARHRDRDPAQPSEVGLSQDRSSAKLVWYRCIQWIVATFFAAYGGWRATGRHNLPEKGGVLLVSNHLSFLDVFLLGIPLRRPLNYVARSTLFLPGLGALIRSVGGFPIQREGMGASGLKETLRRLKNGGIVALFPEGTRSPDGEMREIKPGIAVLVSRARVPVVPAGIAGTFEAWPRTNLIPRPRPIRIHYGPAIHPSELETLDLEQIKALIALRMQESRAIAVEALRQDRLG